MCRKPWRRAALHGAWVLLSYGLLYGVFFSPVLLSDRLLAPGDGSLIYMPYYYSSHGLWTEMLYGGFPLAADVQAQSWYPLARLLSSFPDSWNAFVLAAYVLASAFYYGYVHELTRSRLAGALSGTVFGMSGFMIAHLEHATIVHGAVWIPLMVWSLHRLVRLRDPSGSASGPPASLSARWEPTRRSSCTAWG